MSNNGMMLLSRVIDANDPSALARLNIREEHFGTDVERKAYAFIRDYAEKNRNQAPSYALVTEEVDGFFYVPQVSESYEYLTKRLLNDAAKRRFIEFVENGELSQLYDTKNNDMNTFFSELTDIVGRIKMGTDVRETVGTDIKADGEKFLAEYERRKNGESFRVWKSKFSVVGDYVSGNMYVVYGKSGRGKSVITVEEAVEMAVQGANVLIWAMEMPWFEVLVRLYVSISARKGLTTVDLGGLNLAGGFDAGEIRKGRLTDEFETAFRFFVDTLNDEIDGNIIVRGVDDADFSNRSLAQLEADILTTKADVVIIDPFYYLDYERNTSKTAGGDAAETSKKLRRLTGNLQVVTIAITQAEETKTAKDDEGSRELELPERENVKKTKSLLEDSSMLIAVDTDYKQGRGLVGVNKGRDGGEGTVSEIIYIPQYGIVREMEVGEAAVKDFNF